MNVIVPYADLAPETRSALAGIETVHFVDLTSDSWAYWRLFLWLWEQGQTFVNVEHDIVPWPGAIEELWGCPRDWCSLPYSMGANMPPATALGCTKFSGVLISRRPDAVSRIVEKYRGWSSLDSILTGTLRRNGEPEHVHAPSVRHLHDYDAPRARRRDRLTTKLHYVGAGRFLNGLPTADVEIDDPVLAAQAVESGLYVVAEEPAPTKPVSPAPLPTPTPPSEPAPAADGSEGGSH